MTGEGSPLDVQVLVSGDRRESIDDVAAALADAGLRETSTLPELGVITGVLDDPAKLDAVRAVDGVEWADEGRRPGVPPPDAPVQ